MSQSRKDALKPFEEEKEYMERRIAEGIESNRKGTASVCVVDAFHNPIAGAKIKIKQKTHDFLYGANLFLLDECETEEKNRLYREYFKDTFNQATLPFYWKDLEPEAGKTRYAVGSPRIYRRPAPDLCLEFCEENHITPKGHCLYYALHTPDWVPHQNIEKTKELVEAHFEEIAGRYADRIHFWEVINETLAIPYGKAKNRFYDDPQVVEWCFEKAEKNFPGNELIINECPAPVWESFFGNRSAYYSVIERAVRNHARIDCIGLQAHMFHQIDRYAELSKIFYSPQRVFDVLDTYGQFGRPIQITEVTIPAYSDSKEDEEIQAQALRQMYRMWFCHKNVEMITYWNMVDGYCWSENNIPGDMKSGENFYYGGLLRFDFTPKPAYFALKDLFEKEYRTILETETSSEGLSAIRGFFGTYEIEIFANGKTRKYEIHLAKNEPNNFDLALY